MERPEARRPFVALVAASQHDPQLAAALRERFVAGRRAEATDLLDQIRDQHPDRAHADPDTIIDLTYGALYYRILITGQDLDVTHVDRLLDATVGPVTKPRVAYIGGDA